MARGEVEIRWVDEREPPTARALAQLKARVDLKEWVRSHFSPGQLVDPSVPGAASVHSLVVLWEAEKGVYPAGARSFMTVVATFTRDLGKALKGMEPPYSGVKSVRLRRLIATGAGYAWLHTRFGLKIEKRWKDFIR